jgi:response regulator of citrate/malate metabolism
MLPKFEIMDNVNVLIIEDVSSEIDACKVLTENNYTVVGIATTYNEALCSFKNAVDIIVIDVFF